MLNTLRSHLRSLVDALEICGCLSGLSSQMNHACHSNTTSQSCLLQVGKEAELHELYLEHSIRLVHHMGKVVG